MNLFKSILFIVAFVSFTSLSHAQQRQARMCAYHGYHYQTVVGDDATDIAELCDLYEGMSTDGANNEAAINRVDEILDKVGLFRNFEVQECANINNAIALTMPLENGDLDRYIIYDHAFFQNVSGATGTDWGMVSILAHEVGHHLNGHTLKSEGSNHRIELQADEFSGFVLARMGCALEEAQSAVEKILPDVASETHPAKSDRLAAIKRGWERGSGRKVTEVPQPKPEDNRQIKANYAIQEILAAHINALGGEDNLLQVKTLKITTEGEMHNQQLTADMELVTRTFPIKTEYLYLTPTRHYEAWELQGVKNEMLSLDARQYLKKRDGTWGYYANPNYQGANAIGSYVLEYAYLINNPELTQLAPQEIDGVSYNIIQLPIVEIYDISDADKQVGTKTIRRVYHAETGLLYLVQEEQHFFDSPMADIINSTVYSDYRSVNGLKFAFSEVISMSNRDGQVVSATTRNITDIEINPVVDPQHFKVDEAAAFDALAHLATGLEDINKAAQGRSLLHEGRCEEGLALLLEAGNAGASPAYDDLGELYAHMHAFDCRKAVKKDDEKAGYWFFKSLRSHFATVLFTGDDNKDTERYYVRPRISTIKKGRLTPAQRQFVDAIDLFYKGKKDEAMKQLEASAEAGFVDAQFALAHYSLLTQQMDKRAVWLEKAVALGDPEAKREYLY